MAFCFPTRPKGPSRTSKSSLPHVTFKSLYHISPASLSTSLSPTFSNLNFLHLCYPKLSQDQIFTFPLLGTCFYSDNLTNFSSSFNSYLKSYLLWHLQVSWWLLPLGSLYAWTYLFHTYLLIYGCLSYLNQSFSISWCISILFFNSLRGKQQFNNCLEYKWRKKEKSLQSGRIFTEYLLNALLGLLLSTY